MAQRADAHIHLFEKSLSGTLPDRFGVQVDEAACYDSLAREHDVEAALVVCFQASEGNEANNAYVLRRKQEYNWIHPAVFVDPASPPETGALAAWRDRGAAGLTMYIGPDNADAVRRFPDEIWEWMVERQWLLSVNSSGETWAVWEDVLERHGDLRLVMSHLGLPPKVTEPIDRARAAESLAHQAALARYGETRVKLSGFYALTDPSHDYPHELAWPYVEVLIAEFGVERLLWASDYAPCLNHQTFPQTLSLFWKMPFLSDDARDRIAGGNLLELLREVR